MVSIVVRCWLSIVALQGLAGCSEGSGQSVGEAATRATETSVVPVSPNACDLMLDLPGTGGEAIPDISSLREAWTTGLQHVASCSATGTLVVTSATSVASSGNATSVDTIQISVAYKAGVDGRFKFISTRTYADRPRSTTVSYERGTWQTCEESTGYTGTFADVATIRGRLYGTTHGAFDLLGYLLLPAGHRPKQRGGKRMPRGV